jgi:MscS family membrane protein
MILDNIPLLEGASPAIKALIARLLFVVVAFVLLVVLRSILTILLIPTFKRFAKRIDYDHTTILRDMALPLQFFVIAIAITISSHIFAVGDSVDVFIGNIASSFVILALLMGLYRIIDLLMPSSNRLSTVTGIVLEERIIPFIRTGIKLLIIVMGVVIILQRWNYDVTGLIAGFGLGGLALALAAQDIAANLFGFMALVSDNPFDVGEFVITPDAEGIVEHVGLRTTRLRRLDQALIYVPNSKMANSTIINWSRLEKRRLDYTININYGTTTGEMRVLLHRLREMLKSQEKVDQDSVVVYFIDFTDSALKVLLRCFIYLKDWSEFQAEKERIHLEVIDIITSLGIEFAYPSMSLYVENIPPVSAPIDREMASPQLTLKERAIKDKMIEDVPDTAKTTDNPEENVTGQQDER